MADEAHVAAPEAVVEEPKVEVKAETIEEIIGTKEEKTETPKVVPEAAFLELKKENKQLARDIKTLQTQIENGATGAQVSAGIEKIAEKYEVRKDFLSELTAAIRQDVEADTEKKFSAKLKPFEEKDRAEKVKSAFNTHFDKAMAEMEDYKDVVNRDAIFALSLNPANASKTLPQLIEDTYGNAIAGKRSIETTTPRGGAAPGELDVSRINSDAAYLEEVMKDPTLKKQFDEHVMEIARRA